MRFGRAESVLVVKISLLGEISTRAVVSTTCRFTICVLTTCWYPVYAGDLGGRYPVYAEELVLWVSRLCGETFLGSQLVVDEIGPRVERLYALNPHEAAVASKGGGLFDGL